MGHARIQRGVVADIPFTLKRKKDGTLQDDADWVDGTTAAEWPTATWKNSSSEVDVTASMVRDISGDTITSATHKHPDPTTGIWRSAEGKYWVRIEPASALTLTDYDLDVEFDVSSTETYPETHTYLLVLPGDVDFGDAIDVTWSQVDITGASSITDADQQDLFISQAIDEVKRWVRTCGIDPDSLPTGAVAADLEGIVIRLVRDAVAGVDLGFYQALQSVKEGPESKKWALGVQLSNYEKARLDTMDWCKRYRAFRNVKSAIVRQRPADGLHGYDDP